MTHQDNIQLTLVNKSFDRNQSKILLFQRNVIPNFQEINVAWRVIQNLGLDWSHSFNFPRKMHLRVLDSDGNQSNLMETEQDLCWGVETTDSGNQLKLLGPLASNPPELQVRNGLPQGAISAHVYRDDRLAAVRTNIVPGQMGVFRLKPKLLVAVVSQVTEGQVLDSAILSTVNTELDLSGLASADIVLTGGGAGKSATPFRFTLQNVQRWQAG